MVAHGHVQACPSYHDLFLLHVQAAAQQPSKGTGQRAMPAAYYMDIHDMERPDDDGQQQAGPSGRPPTMQHGAQFGGRGGSNGWRDGGREGVGRWANRDGGGGSRFGGRGGRGGMDGQGLGSGRGAPGMMGPQGRGGRGRGGPPGSMDPMAMANMMPMMMNPGGCKSVVSHGNIHQ